MLGVPEEPGDGDQEQTALGTGHGVKGLGFYQRRSRGTATLGPGKPPR